MFATSELSDMATGVLLGGACIVLAAVVLIEAAEQCGEVCASKRFEELERRLSVQESAIQGLQRQIADQQSTIQDQNRLIQNIQQELRTERQSRKKQSLQLKAIMKDVRRVHQMCLPSPPVDETEIKEGEDNGNRIRGTDPAPRALTKRQARAGIAFSAFLDHVIDTSFHTTINFNQIITNEGSGYNNNTGVFTCSAAGMYLFIVNIGNRTTSAPLGVTVRIVVNNVNMINAVVDAYQRAQNLQGGNAVFVRLKVGDLVWVQTYGGHVLGDATFRFTSFSGAFLYP